MKKFFSIILVFLLFSCATKEEKFQRDLAKIWRGYFVENFDDNKQLQIFVATNRVAKNGVFDCKADSFGISVDASLRLGSCQISVSKNHAVGDISSSKISSPKIFSSEDFFTEIKKSQRTPLVFVHGFNVRFSEAALRAAQIAYDLKYQGPIILFTWPAGSGDGFFEEKMLSKTYENNLANARASREVFKNFLGEMSKRKIAINLFVHSMGHQVVLPALKKFNEENPQKTVVKNLFLNAPDFEIAELRAMVKNIEQVAKRATLYCSNNDKAMSASKIANKNERLGDCAFVKEFDVVNVSAVDDPTFGLGHGYYSSREVLGDVFLALLGVDAKQRLFMAKADLLGAEKFILRK